MLVEARDLGVLQCHLSGGEPLLRRDLVEIVAAAHDLGLYTNLVTSALGLSRPKAEQLRAAGLDHVQVSIQADEPAVSDRIAGTPSFRRKIEAMGVVKELGWPLTVNVVLHRQNIDRVAAVLELAEEVGADRVELANTQYYGWAWRNRDALLPSRAQLEAAEVVVRAARERLRDRMDVIYVIPDYYSRYPKPCMGGWASRQLTVTPNGDVLPCPAAQSLPLPRASVRDDPLDRIWAESPVMTAFRGTDWMPDPCRSCDRRELDFGGCRCQAFQLTGDAARTDPVCHLSPDHDLVARGGRGRERGLAERRSPADPAPAPARPQPPNTNGSATAAMIRVTPLSRSGRIRTRRAAARPTRSPTSDITAVMTPKTAAENTGENPSIPRLAPANRLSRLSVNGMPNSAHGWSSSSGSGLRRAEMTRYRPYTPRATAPTISATSPTASPISRPIINPISGMIPSHSPKVSATCTARFRPNGTVPRAIDTRKLSRLSTKPRMSTSQIMAIPPVDDDRRRQERLCLG